MHCPHCGAPIDAGVRFCPSCRKRVVPPSEAFGNTPPTGNLAPPPPPVGAAPPPPPPFYQAAPASGYQPQVAAALFPPYTVDLSRPGLVTAMAIFDFAGALFTLLGAVLVVLAAMSGGRDGTAMVFLIAGLYAIASLVQLAAGVGLLQMKGWARILQIVVAFLYILTCFGIVIAVPILIYLFKPGARVLFSGKSAEQLAPQEVADLAQLRGSSNAIWIALAVAVVSLPVVAILIGVIAAIAIPSVLRARISANEAGAVGNVRSVISAEAAYQSVNAGYYDVPGCLLAPAQPQCLGSNAPPDGFITPGGIVFDVPTTGYVLRFYPGETVSAPGASPTSLSAFAVVAAPASAQGGVRTFCGDSTGVVCTLSVGGFGATGEDAATGGRCPESCTPLR